MIETIKDSNDASELRRRAEEKLKEATGGSEDLCGVSPERMAHLIHELQVHQIELKMQNDELRRIQGELEKARDRYSHLYDFAPVGYFTVSEKGIIEEVNLTGATMTGIERSALIGRLFSRFVLREDQDIFYKYRQCLLQTETPRSCELRLVRNEGHEFYARMECMVIKNKGNDLRQIRAAVSDITDLKRTEKEFLKAQKLESVGMLAGGIAHDFNNILTAILGNVSMAKMKVRSEDDIFDLLTEAEKASARAQTLTGQLLTFAKGGAPVKRTASIKDVIKESSLLILRGSKSRCEYSLREDLWPAEVDCWANQPGHQ